MNVLVVGAGGREHALVRTLSGSPEVTSLVCAPGNPGIARHARVLPLELGDPDAALALAEREAIDFTIVGPELPLDRGIADRFRKAGHRILGPDREAAQLECSKVFAKGFMSRHGIPTGRYRICESAEDAHRIVASGELGLPVVIKADGLAAGKGVVVAAERAQADAAIRAMMDARQFGDAGARVVLEECLTGPEISFFAVCDGRTAIPLSSAQDHKRIFDDDRGPNTGGMGAFAPSPLLDGTLQQRIMEDIIRPVVNGMRAEGREYRGFLYAGLMLTCNGPRVIEFNVRLGDPEAQVVLPLVSTDLVPLLAGAADGDLADRSVGMTPDVAVGVVLASAGYPGEVKSGCVIRGLDAAEALDEVSVLHAGTAHQGNEIVTAGGRVLTVVAWARTFDAAIARAYEGVSKISFEGMQYRTDIGRRALKIAKIAKI
jgi:phosphoribosylamine--glycine ligase